MAQLASEDGEQPGACCNKKVKRSGAHKCLHDVGAINEFNA
jgi:hypothetical protein